MKKIYFNLIGVFTIVFVFPFLCFSQISTNKDLQYEVHRIYKPMSISKVKLNDAKTLVDLNRNYKPSWIKAFISVEIFTAHNGKIRITRSENDTLSKEQKGNMLLADVGTEIAVLVKYIPDNSLPNNDAQEINFSVPISPDIEAKYPGGKHQLKKYLKEHTIDKIPETSFKQYQLSAVNFTIDEEGHVTNVHVFQSSGDEKIDELLLETICNMPNWKPAEYSNGLKVKQECSFTVGDMESCVINLLNIRQDRPVKID